MRFLPRPSTLYLLLTYVLLSAVPFVPLAFGKPVEHPWRILGIEVAGWLAVWAVFQRPAWFHWLLLPAFFALPVEIYLHAYFGQGISTHHIGIIAETSPKESMEFLGNKIWLLAGVAVGVIAWFATTWKLAWSTKALRWTGWSRWTGVVLVAAAGTTGAYAWQYGVAEPAKPVAASKEASGSDAVASQSASPSDDAATLLRASFSGDGAPADAAASESAAPDAADAEASAATEDSAASEEEEEPTYLLPTEGRSSAMPKLPSWVNPPFGIESLGQAWPFGIAMHGYDYYKERKYLAELAVKSSAFQFNARQPDDMNTPQVVVMVIGESSRYDRWSLNGYKRDTTPLLRQEPNVVSLSNVVTAVSATRLSVPVIISRKPATQSLKAGFSEKSFLTAFKEAGFKTYWLSNQMSFGQFDTPISVFAKEAHVTQFMNLGGFTNESTYDQILLDPLRIAIADPAPKKLIVLHTLGNHWNYSHRHPKEFDKWQPSLFGIRNPAYTDLKWKEHLNNSYDNSILYTDWFLSQVIGSLKASSQLASLVYVSDHGQTLYDGSCDLAFHGHNTQYEFHVPAFVWVSDQYKELYPHKMERLRKNRKAKLTTENMFHSLLDMADIRYPTEQLERSFFHKKFRSHKRYVDSYGWTDYDNATFKGDCREVIAKGKPLVQEK
ncbi:MAG TPA: phosphoethanolamine transferase [Noviherbaspirillum sp.]|nr:phosphoethanolamine transferase [Noviherbaspirillum sp.]